MWRPSMAGSTWPNAWSSTALTSTLRIAGKIRYFFFFQKTIIRNCDLIIHHLTLITAADSLLEFLNFCIMLLIFFIKWKIFNWTATRNYTWFQDWDSFMYIWILLLLRQPLADAEGAKKFNMMELLKAHGGLSYVSPITNASFLLLDVCMLHDEPFVSSIAFVSSDWDSACCRVKMEVTLNQSQSLPLCQTSVTGKLTLLSWTSQPRQLLGRWGATLISED